MGERIAMPEVEVSLFRLYLLRAMYAFILWGLAVFIWPPIIHHSAKWAVRYGVENCLLGTVAVLAALGIRYPLKMLPVLFFEMIWKAIWLIAIAYPLWTTHQIDAETSETVGACLMGVIVPIVIPWRYVFENYIRAKGDRWGRSKL